jgi:hypothetical protein
MHALTNWAERTPLFIGDRTLEHYVLRLGIEDAIGELTGPWCENPLSIRRA